MMDVFDFLLNDRNGDVYRSESEKHKHLLRVLNSYVKTRDYSSLLEISASLGDVY